MYPKIKCILFILMIPAATLLFIQERSRLTMTWTGLLFFPPNLSTACPGLQIFHTSSPSLGHPRARIFYIVTLHTVRLGEKIPISSMYLQTGGTLVPLCWCSKPDGCNASIHRIPVKANMMSNSLTVLILTWWGASCFVLYPLPHWIIWMWFI